MPPCVHATPDRQSTKTLRGDRIDPPDWQSNPMSRLCYDRQLLSRDKADTVYVRLPGCLCPDCSCRSPSEELFARSLPARAKAQPVKIQAHDEETGFQPRRDFPGCHKPVTDCLMQSLDIKDAQASIFQCVAIDKVDAVKSAFRVVVCRGHRIFLLKNGNNRASADLQCHDYLDIPSSHLALQCAPEFAMIVVLGSVNDSSNTQC